MGTGRRPMLWLYIGLPLLALLLVIASALAPKSYPDYSTYSPAPSGTKAFYLLLEQFKYPVARSKEFIPKEGKGLMLLIEPEVLSKKEAIQLVKWVTEGNNLFIINNKVDTNSNSETSSNSGANINSSTNNNSDQLSKLLRLSWTDEAREQKMRVKPDKLYFKDVNYLMLSQGRRLKAKEPDVEFSYEDEKGAYLVVFKKGQGRIIYLADAPMVTNRQINAQDNSVFIMNIINNNLASANQSHLWVNEWVHGFTPNTEVRELLTWPIRLAVLQILIGLLLLFHYWGKRFSKPVPVPPEGEGIIGDMVSSLANIYRQGRARNLILANTYQSFRYGLTHYLGVPTQTANEKIINIIAQRPHIDVASLEKLLQRIEKELQFKKLNESELLSLVRQMEVWQQDNLTSLQERRKNK